ncbi:MAG: hypothetical protein ACTTKL_09645 [Treponema sp.]
MIKPFFTMPFYKATKQACAYFLSNVWNNFFALQQKQKFRLSKIPVINVDHPLDEKIPFVKNKMQAYSDFVGLFLRVISMFLKKLNRHTAGKLCSYFLIFIGSLYANAAFVYRFCMTTTSRPKYQSGFKFLLIRLLDPHLLCVPSLHVAIAAGVYAFVRQAFADIPDSGISPEEKERFLSEIYRGALEITESVLFVKQHSVNCVAAALYMVSTMNGEGFFSEEDALRFIEKLFSESAELYEDDAREIREYTARMYSSLLADYQTAAEWQNPLFRWIKNYAEQTEQTADLTRLELQLELM